MIQKKLYIDITNFIDTKLNTGIQRVLKEFLYRAIEDKNIDLKILYFNQEKKEYILIPKTEYKVLLDDIASFSINYNNFYNIYSNPKEKKYFFDLDRVWNSNPNRTKLYKKLKEANFYIINYIYDMIPILFPKYFYKETKRNFPLYIDAILNYSNHIFFDSNSCQNDFLKYKKIRENKRKIRNSVLHLGCDFKIPKSQNPNQNYTHLLKKKYILFVGTIEPRKKHKELLDVFEHLQKQNQDLNLIFIGKFGWHMEKFEAHIKHHHLLNNSFYYLQDIDDETLVSFYQNAFIVCYLSKYEGFGLPVAESLYFGNITIASKNSSLKEISKNIIFETPKNSLLFRLTTYIQNKKKYTKTKELIKKSEDLMKWDDFYTRFANSLKHL